MKKNNLFLIVIDPDLAEKMGGVSALQDDFRATSNIRLCKKKDKKGGWVLTLSLPRGRALILYNKPNKKNYFRCIRPPISIHPPASMKYCLEIDAEALIVDSGKVDRYQRDALDCATILKDLENKTEWNPQEGSDPEDKKWATYINLHKGIYKNRRFGLMASDYEKFGKVAQVKINFGDMLDYDSIVDKINAAKRQRISFSLSPALSFTKGKKRSRKELLGNLKSFDEQQGIMKIQLDNDFNGFRTAVAKRDFYARETAPSVFADGDSVLDNVAKIEFGDVETKDRTMFFHDENRKIPAFSCLAECTAPNEWRIASDSIKPQTMTLSADFISELYQLNTMDNGLKKIKSRSIWQVLTRERVSKLPEDVDIVWSDDCHLNENQKNAVKKAVGAQELCLIWGPPGTGKTEVIMEIAKQECSLGHKTLIASQANLAVDNALARLHGSDNAWTFRNAVDEYKLEHEDKNRVPVKDTRGIFFAKRLCATIEQQKDESDDVVSDLRKKLVTQLNKLINSPQKFPMRAFPQLAVLYNSRINVVGATLMRTGKTIHKEENLILSETEIPEFDTVIVDEISKALPTELFLPVLLGKKVVLVGDHKQLPPMLEVDFGDSLTLEEWANEAGVPKKEIDTETTLFQQLWEKHSNDASGVRQMLTKQYRMHEEIQRIIEPFYQDKEERLECGLDENKQREMCIAHVDPWGKGHAFWVDNDSHEEEEGTSFYNLQEIDTVGNILELLPKKGADNKYLSVGVITFYGAQLRLLRKHYESKYSQKFTDGRLIFGTVDRFQGRECDVIICSLVRKNKNSNIGFATKPNRINVAFSRARRALCIVGSRQMFCYEAPPKAAEIYLGVYSKCLPLKKDLSV